MYVHPFYSWNILIFMYYVDEAEKFATVHGVRVSLVFQLFYTVGLKINYEKQILMLCF